VPFGQAWAEIANSNKEWHLLVEDDLKFTHKPAECWNQLVTYLDGYEKQTVSWGAVGLMMKP
jgi:hypothetical protein